MWVGFGKPGGSTLLQGMRNRDDFARSECSEGGGLDWKVKSHHGGGLAFQGRSHSQGLKA